MAKIPLNRIKKFKKACSFCEAKKDPDYKDVDVLKRQTSERGKILSRERTGNCSRHQRKMTIAVKRARYLALIPFVKNR